MSALIIVMLWISLNLTIEHLLNKRDLAKKKKSRRVQRKNYDFDIVSYGEDYVQLKRSA